MREFIYYSRSAPTKGNYGDDIFKAGRLDIAIHSVIASFFLSHSFRNDVKLHLVFAGAPDPVKHLELKPVTEGKTGKDKIYLSKKDVSGIIKRMLYKYKEGKKTEVFPGYWIEKKALLNIVEELHNNGKEIFVLDGKGEDIRDIKISNDSVFVIGDHLGLPKKELKRIKSIAKPVSVGKRTYFASQTITLVNNEIDRREDSAN